MFMLREISRNKGAGRHHFPPPPPPLVINTGPARGGSTAGTIATKSAKSGSCPTFSSGLNHSKPTDLSPGLSPNFCVPYLLCSLLMPCPLVQASRNPAQHHLLSSNFVNTTTDPQALLHSHPLKICMPWFH